MNTTLLGGRPVKVNLLDGTEAEFKVRQLPLNEYEKGFAIADDEIALTALICGHPKEWAYNLQPESYEALYQAAKEVNERGFFASYRRHTEAALQREVAISAVVAQMPEEMRRTVMEAGAKAMASATGRDSSSPPRPQRT